MTAHRFVQGWLGDRHYLLFNEPSRVEITKGYNLAVLLPGFTAIGIADFEDLLVLDHQGQAWATPLIPIDPKGLSQVSPPELHQLEPDICEPDLLRFRVHPLRFGGDPTDASNLQLISLEKHFELVSFWNVKYQSEAARSSGRSKKPGLLSRIKSAFERLANSPKD